MLTKRSFTLIEILVVMIIIGILASLGLPNYNRIKEKALDREAKATLALIRTAERTYRMEEGDYYPSSITADINKNLRLSLPDTASPRWVYKVSATGEATAERTEGDFIRTWLLQSSGSDETPTCDSVPPGNCLN